MVASGRFLIYYVQLYVEINSGTFGLVAPERLVTYWRGC